MMKRLGDTRPVGIFDSGLGGLSALKEVRRLLPGEDLIYFGDTGRTPYGTRSAGMIGKYAREDAAFLLKRNVKAIVVACGTVSSIALDALRAESSVPVIGIVDYAAKEAAAATKNGRIGVMGTSATIHSGVFEKKIAELSPQAEVTSVACPLLVPLVEYGFGDEKNALAAPAVEYYLKKIRAAGCDTVILGCTHFPLLSPVIASLAPSLTQINAGASAAHELYDVLFETGLLNPLRMMGSTQYYVSDLPQNFEATARVFLGEDIRGEVTQIAVE